MGEPPSSGTVLIGRIEARTHGFCHRLGAGPVAAGPDRPGAPVQLVAAQVPEAQGLRQVVAQVLGPREALVTHQQPGQIDQVAIGGHRHGQELVDQVPVLGIEGMGLLQLGHGGIGRMAGPQLAPGVRSRRGFCRPGAR